MRIRPGRSTDDPSLRLLQTAAFDDEGQVASVAEALRQRPDTAVSIVAEAGDSVVGHVQLSIAWVDAPDRLIEVLVLSPLGVLPEHQRRGVGRALIRAARAEAIRLGSPLLFVEGDPAYYSAHGFVSAVPLGFPRPSVRIPEPAFQVDVLTTWTGETGAFVYNDTFWSFDAVGLRTA